MIKQKLVIAVIAIIAIVAVIGIVIALSNSPQNAATSQAVVNPIASPIPASTAIPTSTSAPLPTATPNPNDIAGNYGFASAGTTMSNGTSINGCGTTGDGD